MDFLKQEILNMKDMITEKEIKIMCSSFFLLIVDMTYIACYLWFLTLVTHNHLQALKNIRVHSLSHSN